MRNRFDITLLVENLNVARHATHSPGPSPQTPQFLCCPCAPGKTETGHLHGVCHDREAFSEWTMTPTLMVSVQVLDVPISESQVRREGEGWLWCLRASWSGVCWVRCESLLESREGTE